MTDSKIDDRLPTKDWLWDELMAGDDVDSLADSRRAMQKAVMEKAEVN